MIRCLNPFGSRYGSFMLTESAGLDTGDLQINLCRAQPISHPLNFQPVYKSHISCGFLLVWILNTPCTFYLTMIFLITFLYSSVSEALHPLNPQEPSHIFLWLLDISQGPTKLFDTGKLKLLETVGNSLETSYCLEVIFWYFYIFSELLRTSNTGLW